MTTNTPTIAIIGLGYVGLPLAVEFAKQYSVLGYDINAERVAALIQGVDSTLEVDSQDLTQAQGLSFTCTVDDLATADIYIVTVPTPIDAQKMPDLTPLISASQAIGKVLSAGNIVIYESTVYPGATEEDCVPHLEAVSGLKMNQDFFVGFSPERINPGDKNRRVKDIVKVTSGSTPEVADQVDALYRSIITAGTHKAPSIKVAEGSKIIENIQRDVNIALINELYQIFERMGIDTNAVVEAAATKWNFMKLKPGLVGGHCIGVDPYYLLHKSQATGYVPDLMRTAREINDGMSDFLCSQFLRELVQQGINPVRLNVLILGFTFKENCPDIRNTKVVDVARQLKTLGFNVTIYDPHVNIAKAKAEYDLTIINTIDKKYDAGFLTVGHTDILEALKTHNLEFTHDFIFDFKKLLSS